MILTIKIWGFFDYMSTQRATHNIDKYLDTFLDHCTQNKVAPSAKDIEKFRHASSFEEQMSLYQEIFKIDELSAGIFVDELRRASANSNAPKPKIEQKYVSYLLNKEFSLCRN
jgi:hypothetical protein